MNSRSGLRSPRSTGRSEQLCPIDQRLRCRRWMRAECERLLASREMERNIRRESRHPRRLIKRGLRDQQRWQHSRHIVHSGQHRAARVHTGRRRHVGHQFPSNRRAGLGYYRALRRERQQSGGRRRSSRRSSTRRYSHRNTKVPTALIKERALLADIPPLMTFASLLGLSESRPPSGVCVAYLERTWTR
jgi:hypothetical protein